ncbi:MAG: DnaJ domain-containing protein [Desulfobacterales bacterium]
MDKTPNYYEFLEVDPAAPAEAIRHAYRRKLKAFHPDKNPRRQAEAEKITKVLNQAYHVLGDPGRRKAYDRMLRFAGGRDFKAFDDDGAFARKMERAAPVFGKVRAAVNDLYALFRDAVAGRYRLDGITLGVIAAGLSYFFIPTDLVPDFIPLLGFVDDLAVLTTIINALQGELAAYRGWRKWHPRA